MAGIPEPDSSTQQVGQFGILGPTGLSDLPKYTRDNVSRTLKSQMRKGGWKDSSDSFWTGVEPDGVSPWSANYTKTIGTSMKGGDAEVTGTTLPELKTDLSDYFASKWTQLSSGTLGDGTSNGAAVFVDFAQYTDGTALPVEFDQVYSGSGTGLWGVKDGKAFWYPVNDADRTCFAVYGDKTTTSDYQKVGFALSTRGQWFSSTSAGANFLLARADAAATEFIYARLRLYDIEVGYYTLVSGVPTKTVVDSFSHSLAATETYWLRAGTSLGSPGNITVQVLKNNSVLWSGTMAGAALDASHRFAGMGVFARATSSATADPGRVAAWGFSDNVPAVTVGSGATMIRLSTSNVTMSSGQNALPSNFFDDTADVTSDIIPDLTSGSFLVSVSGWYYAQWQCKINAIGRKFQPWLYKNGSAWREFGTQVLSDDTASNEAESFAAGAVVYLSAGDTLGLGHFGNSTPIVTTSVTGDSTGAGTHFTISLINRSLE